MAHRISAKHWVYFKEKNPVGVSSLYHITIDKITDTILRDFWKKGQKKNISIVQSNFLETLIDWINDNCTEQYYAEIKKDGGRRDRRRRPGRRPAENDYGVTFHFFSEDDALLFKLTWWGDI